MIYHKQQLLLASKHRKEQVIAPVFKHYLDAELLVATFDTDQLGTFTGEIPRLATPTETCVLKARQAGLACNHDYVIASEGSFAPHPQIPFLAVAHEIMLLLDLKRQLMIVEEEISTKTNYQTLVIDKNQNLDDFLKKAQFPSHALCLQTADQVQVIAKGIQTHEDLEHFLEQGFTISPQLLVSSDMRAMMNPCRMQNLASLSEKLAKRILSTCPKCQLPGFGQIGVSGHLPCQVCHQESDLHALEVLGCIQCEYQITKTRSDGKATIPPQFCQYCNP